ncbi:hypothetical protein K523DRAFT_366823, partial [Schizophyllum commune Tattone D]
MSASRALLLPEILPQIFDKEPLSQPDFGRFARVTSAWQEPATAALWKHMSSLEPLLRLLSEDSYEWIHRRRQIDGCMTQSIVLRLSLTDDQCLAVFRRLNMIRHFTLNYRRCNLDLAIQRGIAHLVEPLLGPCLRGLRTITIHPPPEPHSPDFLPILPLALDGAWSSQTTFDIPHLIASYPQVSAFFVGGEIDRARYLRVLHIRGQPIDFLLDIIQARSPWFIEELYVVPDDMSCSDMIDLFEAVVRYCCSLQYLHIAVHRFQDDENWFLTPETFRILTSLPLVDLWVEAPLRSFLSDVDWEAALRSWPSLQSLRIEPGTEYAWLTGTFSLVSGVPPACSANVLSSVASLCPCMDTLALPGINCRRLPSTDRSKRASTDVNDQLGHPLRQLVVYDSPLRDPDALSSFLRHTFPNLHILSYWPYSRPGAATWHRQSVIEDDFDVKRWELAIRGTRTTGLSMGDTSLSPDEGVIEESDERVDQIIEELWQIQQPPDAHPAVCWISIIWLLVVVGLVVVWASGSMPSNEEPVLFALCTLGFAISLTLPLLLLLLPRAIENWQKVKGARLKRELEAVAIYPPNDTRSTPMQAIPRTPVTSRSAS